VLPIAVVLLTLDRRRFQPPCRAPDPLAPPALARLAAVAALAESVARGARVERLTAGPAQRKAKRLLDSFMLVHASVPRTRGAHGLTPRPRSGTVRGVQSRVRVWAEGPGLPPRAFTLCASISSRLLRQDVRRHERSSLPIRPARGDQPFRHAERMLGVLRPDASGIRRFFASLYNAETAAVTYNVLGRPLSLQRRTNLALGISPTKLEGVIKEGTAVLPGLF
jgi:hypothetical protein